MSLPFRNYLGTLATSVHARAIRMEEKIKEEEEERREAPTLTHSWLGRQAERLAKLPFASTSDEKHLEQLKQEPKAGI